ncbi:2-dehydro-3-deoxyphosphogluconate aldolase [Oenococcus oeni]|uniref:bifunctional 4-hydroxy-2-oxoglutarate aldolase/2-dehydro-3-deoxy-phosphogluconate aldolase n=1 Tax=Oenococcus oeni TaxID=1247 RepID=UPI0008F8015F|nr:2-dehydro-3-deoxyphosphogluconate aldolase [Oenococcus oeni]OIK85250.1 2-dehydro-3-deoxyphosphogluconate aldolase [Oenococcus oeni]OIL08288.1 2-dehydro-3-deoxyphosphogluconate aldolase [Oenococcus oeni]OIL11284.1 2-dehydro-3-deoxyphosphogluconate aldolase [Oenococcus oeni]
MLDINNYPKITIIMRGYTYDQALTIIKLLSNFHHKVGIEVTTNNADYLRIIRDGNNQFGMQVDIGVGTILNVQQASEAIDAGAKFMLGPISFDSKIFQLARRKKVLGIPAAMTPTEVVDQFRLGADIVKIFPAVTVGGKFFKQIQGPLGKLKLMAVGGLNINNAYNFFENGASYIGVGSSMFNQEDIRNKDEKGLSKSVQDFLRKVPD